MPGLTASMPFFSNVQNQLVKNNVSADVASAFINQVVAAANLSSTLSQQILNFQTSREPLTISGTSSTYTTQNGGALNLAIQPSYDTSGNTGLTTGVTFGSSNSTVPIASSEIPPVGIFIGTLAHELGHFEDSNLTQGMPSVNSPVNQGIYSGTELLSEGKATANAVQVAEEIAANTPVGGSGVQVLIPLGSDYASALNLVTGNAQNPYSTTSVGAFASYFANLPTSMPGNPTYFSYYWNSWTGPRDLVDPSTVTGASVVENSNGGLQACP